MKLKFIIFLAIVAFNLNSMEEQLPQGIMSEVAGSGAWNSLPKELKLEIVSYVTGAKSVGGLINNLKSIRAVSKEFKELVKHIINDFAKKYVAEHSKEAENELFDALKKGKIPVALALINAGINANSRHTVGIDNYTLLAQAVSPIQYEPNIQIVQALIEHGADVNSESLHSQITPLMQVARDANVEIVRLLINAKADVNAQTGWKKMSPLMYAVGSATIGKFTKKIVKLLIDAGANVNAKNHLGKSVLTIAKDNLINKPKGQKIVKLLIDAGAKE